MINDVGKVILLTVGLVIFGTALVLGIILHDPTALTTGAGGVGTIVGYMTGNGVLAARGEAPSPAYVPRHEKVAERVASKVAKRVLDVAREDAEHDQ